MGILEIQAHKGKQGYQKPQDLKYNIFCNLVCSVLELHSGHGGWPWVVGLKLSLHKFLI